MTTTTTRKTRSRWWILFALAAIAAVAVLATQLTSPRAGGFLDPESTATNGSHALATLLREHGVEVIEANTVDEAVSATTGNSTLLVAPTYYLPDRDKLQRLSRASGDLLLIAPNFVAQDVLAPGLRAGASTVTQKSPGCDLRAARRAGTVDFDTGRVYRAASDSVDLTSCYGGALVRYRNGAGQTVTVAANTDFLTNDGLRDGGNAALAMNLAGEHPRLVWYAPQQLEGEKSSSASITDLMPDRVGWVIWQLIVAVALLALWQGRRLGPLIAEPLPVVVRASETVEGRGRLYQSHRARDRAADALRSATISRLAPRLGLSAAAGRTQIVDAIAAHSGTDPARLTHLLYGPAPATDDDLINLAHALDDIERQVAHP